MTQDSFHSWIVSYRDKVDERPATSSCFGVRLVWLPPAHEPTRFRGRRLNFNAVSRPERQSGQALRSHMGQPGKRIATPIGGTPRHARALMAWPA